jgi:hypothetical protein
MPLPLTKEIEDCQAHAAHCARQAKNAGCPNIREDFLRLEQNWLQLAQLCSQKPWHVACVGGVRIFVRGQLGRCP